MTPTIGKYVLGQLKFIIKNLKKAGNTLEVDGYTQGTSINLSKLKNLLSNISDKKNVFVGPNKVLETRLCMVLCFLKWLIYQKNWCSIR